MKVPIDKTILLAATTKALLSIDGNFDEYDTGCLQLICDILKSKNSVFIGQDVLISDYEYSLIEEYLEVV